MRSFFYVVVAAAWVGRVLVGPVSGQTPEVPTLNGTSGAVTISNNAVDRDVFGGGIFYWSIVHIERNETIARGTMDVEGIDRIILAPRTAYRMLSFYAETLSFGFIDFTTPPAGNTFQIACMPYRLFEAGSSPDADGDDLPDFLEEIAGTNPNNPDSDGDTAKDGPEVRQGSNPLDGFFAATGIIASGPTPAAALDVCTINNTAIVACGLAGVAVFNVRQGNAPTRIAQVDTPGNAISVACFSNLIAVADRQAGLAVVDISDPPAAQIIHLLRFNSPANAVTARGNFAFVGLDNGDVVMVDMITGTEVGRNTIINGKIQDLGERKGYVYALTTGTLHTIEIADGEMTRTDTETSPGSIGAGQVRQRVFVGDDFLYTTETAGFNTFDISSPEAPVHLEDVSTTQRGWKHIVADGSANAVAAVSPNSTADGNHDVDLYNVGADNLGSTYVSTFTTPGRANAVSLYNGLAYIADGTAGLQVINYLAFDTGGVPPTLSLNVQSSEGAVEEGKVFSVAAEVMDDVLVRNVEFYIDGQPVALDGNFPFEIGLISPIIQGDKNTFELYAVATDTGGNTTQSATQTFTLVPDATPPRVRVMNPRPGAVTGTISTVFVNFSEPVQVPTLIPSIRLALVGADGAFDTEDDILVPFTIDYTAETATLALVLVGPSDPGLYRLRIGTTLRDLAGNRLVEPYLGRFRVYSFVDSDRDGVPDDLEAVLGLGANNPDSDADGIPDGLEDNDNDGLVNSGEVILNNDPLNPDTDGNGVQDGAEDQDLDGLNDGDEVLAGTDATQIDSDGDGVADPTEIDEGTDPNDAADSPAYAASSDLVSYLNGTPGEIDGGLPFSLASSTASYLNALPVAPPEGVEFATASSVVSYLNALPVLAPEDVEFTAASSVVSYLNGLVGPASAEEDQFYAPSPVVSYDNQLP